MQGTPDNALQAMHCTSAIAPRPGSWPVAPLSSSLDRATTEGSAFMVQALTLLHPWCTPDKARQQCPGRRCSGENWGPLWPPEPKEDRAPPSRKIRATQRAHCTGRLLHKTNMWNTALSTGTEMNTQQPGWTPSMQTMPEWGMECRPSAGHSVPQCRPSAGTPSPQCRPVPAFGLQPALRASIVHQCRPCFRVPNAPSHRVHVQASAALPLPA